MLNAAYHGVSLEKKTISKMIKGLLILESLAAFVPLLIWFGFATMIVPDVGFDKDLSSLWLYGAPVLVTVHFLILGMVKLGKEG